MPAKRTASAPCKAPGCSLAAGVLGYCARHSEFNIKDAFLAAVEKGYASPHMPPCFGAMADYQEYIVRFIVSMWGTGARARNEVDYCRDCSMSFKSDMEKAGRCNHPETIFLYDERLHGDLIGVSCANPARWEASIIGSFGHVVRVPPDEVVAQMFKNLSRRKQ